MNPLYDMMKNNGLPPIVQQFMQFKQNYNGDARAQIQQMLSSGKTTRAEDVLNTMEGIGGVRAQYAAAIRQE